MNKIDNYAIFDKIVNSTKKVIVFFVLFVFLLNGFVPKGQEFKESLIESFNCAVSAVENNFLDEYTNAAMSIINNIMQKVCIAVGISGKVSKQEEQGAGSKESVPINNSSEELIIREKIRTDSVTNYAKIKMLEMNNFVNDKVSGIYSSMINREGIISGMGILFFILFSIVVIRIKDVMDNNIIKKEYKKEPAWV
jgi:hypothetical protein